MVTKRSDAGNSSSRRPPARTPEGREIQLQALAYDLAEKRLREGSASSAEIVYLLKSATLRDKLELEKIRNDNLLAEAKIGQIQAAAGQDTLLREAMAAFTEYRGGELPPEEDTDEY